MQTNPDVTVRTAYSSLSSLSAAEITAAIEEIPHFTAVDYALNRAVQYLDDDPKSGVHSTHAEPKEIVTMCLIHIAFDPSQGSLQDKLQDALVRYLPDHSSSCYDRQNCIYTALAAYDMYLEQEDLTHQMSKKRSTKPTFLDKLRARFEPIDDTTV